MYDDDPDADDEIRAKVKDSEKSSATDKSTVSSSAGSASVGDSAETIKGKYSTALRLGMEALSLYAMDDDPASTDKPMVCMCVCVVCV